ncbi:MAG: hypothetical protein QME66_01915 [Candidatus Eisenbacteria bacterium]|nr:hypothetical protein [Candidatus Eisenbacteria bacterium]
MFPLVKVAAGTILSFLPLYLGFRSQIPRLSERLLTSSLVLAALITLVEIALGVPGFLNPIPVFLGTFILSAFIGFAAYRLRARIGDRKTVKPPRELHALILICLAGLVYVLIGIYGYLVPTGEGDANTYHLPAIFYWAQEGRIIVPPLPGAAFYYPMGGELFGLWIFLLGGSVRLLNLVQIPFTFMAALSLYAAASQLGMRGRLAIPLFVLTPIVILQSATPMVDCIVSAFYLTCLAFLLMYFSEPRNLYLVLSGIAAGLLIGSKPGAFIFFPPLFLVFMFGFFSSRERIPGLIKSLGLAALLAIIFGGYWYVRNAVQTGNPIFPYSISLGKSVLVQGIEQVSTPENLVGMFVATKLGWFAFPFRESIRGLGTYSAHNGFGIQFLLAYVSIPFALALSLKKRNWLLLSVILSFFLAFLLFVAIHPIVHPRFVIFLVGIAYLSFLYVVSNLKKGARCTAIGLASIAILISCLFSMPDIFMRFKTALDARNENGGSWNYSGYKEFGAVGQAVEWISRNAPSGAGITFCQPEFIAPLFGERAENRVFYVSPRRTWYPNVPHAETFFGWMGELRERKADYILLWPYYAAYDYREIAWMNEHPEFFNLEKSWGELNAGGVAVYRIVDQALPVPDLDHEDYFSSPSEWFLFERVGAGAAIHRNYAEKSFTVDFSFEEGKEQYFEIGRYLKWDSLSPYRKLTFTISGDLSDLKLDVYLKAENPKQYQKQTVEMVSIGAQQTEMPSGVRSPGQAVQSQTTGSAQRVCSVDITNPDFRTKRFSLKDADSIVLVAAPRPGGKSNGSLTFKSFKLEN